MLLNLLMSHDKNEPRNNIICSKQTFTMKYTPLHHYHHYAKLIIRLIKYIKGLKEETKGNLMDSQ